MFSIGVFLHRRFFHFYRSLCCAVFALLICIDNSAGRLVHGGSTFRIKLAGTYGVVRCLPLGFRPWRNGLLALSRSLIWVVNLNCSGILSFIRISIKSKWPSCVECCTSWVFEGFGIREKGSICKTAGRGGCGAGLHAILAFDKLECPHFFSVRCRLGSLASPATVTTLCYCIVLRCVRRLITQASPLCYVDS